jgi:hypothetical protein
MSSVVLFQVHGHVDLGSAIEWCPQLPCLWSNERQPECFFMSPILNCDVFDQRNGLWEWSFCVPLRGVCKEIWPIGYWECCLPCRSLLGTIFGWVVYEKSIPKVIPLESPVLICCVFFMKGKPGQWDNTPNVFQNVDTPTGFLNPDWDLKRNKEPVFDWL